MTTEYIESSARALIRTLIAQIHPLGPPLGDRRWADQ